MSQSAQTSSSLLCNQLKILFQIFSLSNPAIDVMQSTKNWLAYNLTIGLNRAMDRRVFLKRHMRSADVVIIIDVFVQHTLMGQPKLQSVEAVS